MGNAHPTLVDILWLRHASYQNISQVVHPRHRSISNFMVNIIAVRLYPLTTGLIGYTWQKLIKLSSVLDVSFIFCMLDLPKL